MSHSVPGEIQRMGGGSQKNQQPQTTYTYYDYQKGALVRRYLDRRERNIAGGSAKWGKAGNETYYTRNGGRSLLSKLIADRTSLTCSGKKSLNLLLPKMTRARKKLPGGGQTAISRSGKTLCRGQYATWFLKSIGQNDQPRESWGGNTHALSRGW